MANKYWVGGTGNWSDNTNHWSDSSNGSPGAALPTSADDVFFDQYSFNTTGQTVTIDATAPCKSMNWTGAQYSPTLSIGAQISLYGDLTLISAMSVVATVNTGFSFYGTGDYNITTNGLTGIQADITCSSSAFSGSVTFQDDWHGQQTGAAISSWACYNGTWNLNGKTITVASWLGPNSATRVVTVNMQNSTLNVYSGATSYWGVADLVTINAEGSTINIQTIATADWYFNGTSGGPFTFGTVNFNAATNNIYGSNTFANLGIAAGKTVNVTSGKTQTVTGNFTANGRTAAITIKSSVANSIATISKTSGTANVYNCTVTDIVASGGATFNAYNSTIDAESTGWTALQERFWVGDSGNYTDTTHWSLVSGGASGASVPNNVTDIYFDANSFTQIGQTVTMNVSGQYCRNMDWTGAQYSPTFALTGGGINFCGSIKFITDMAYSAAGNYMAPRQAVAGATLDFAGHTLNTLGWQTNSTGVFTLANDLTVSGQLMLVAGGLKTNGYTVNCGYFSGSYDYNRTLDISDSEFNINTNGFTLGYAAKLTFTGTNSVINMNVASSTFTGAGQTFGKVHFAQNGTIADANTFDELSAATGKILYLTSGITQTINKLSADGAALTSTSSGTAYTLSKAAGELSKIGGSIKDLNLDGGCRLFAFDCTNVSGNDSEIVWRKTTLDNIVVDGNFDSLTNWAVYYATHSISNNICTNTGNGSGQGCFEYQDTTTILKGATRYYARAKLKITNSTYGTNLKIRLHTTTEYGTALVVQDVTTPIQGTLYTLSGIATTLAGWAGYYAQLELEHLYDSAAHANGASCEMSEIILIDVSLLSAELQAMSDAGLKAYLDSIPWFDGTGTLPVFEYSNKILEPNFDNLDNWEPYNGTESVSANIVAFIGDGSSNVDWELQDTSLPYETTDKYYVSSRMRVTNAVSSELGMGTRGITTGGTNQYISVVPTQNLWYLISGIITPPSDADGYMRYFLYHSYVDTTTQNGKVANAHNVRVVKLSDLPSWIQTQSDADIKAFMDAQMWVDYVESGAPTLTVEQVEDHFVLTLN